MRFDILTIFPQIFDSYLDQSILKRAQAKKLIEIHVHDIRKYSKQSHKKVDDIPYGGGAGMVMTPQPIYDAIKALKKVNKGRVIYFSPRGAVLTQQRAEKYAQELIKKPKTGFILLCGRYEGIDERIIEMLIDEEVSIGKYILTGGEIPAMTFVDCVSRLIPGVLGKEESHLNDSFSKALKRKKEYPIYTRPRVFKNKKVPDVLFSGNHKDIEQWKNQHLK
ncbi:tRNA (guanosine(37)-N1)-methyltransferase TrmD [Candidatus Peregrinibacteria bacterium CG_4_10_14_0_2_um_filter_38_24]|nr:MAG: tRNA (guanosine(37)-N1)-methyltransferase TrmD [Candidatus Peregrinibacteria bacterium CG_4_10_14_0_2_um_filter_38_24]PJC38957.1 MAG: tRNA (guanosine(37)-N1)-methyltransferase TrmD [Candidatus Peregrinibacteria bacterium CG_4_9_14_0_2_um_filter_38_9]